MKYKYLISCIFLILGMGISSYSQVDLSSLGASKLKKLGSKAQDQGDYFSAARYYEAYCKSKEDYKIMFELAECYRFERYVLWLLKLEVS